MSGARRVTFKHGCADVRTTCGKFVPGTGDLFGEAPKDPDWQLLSEPLSRLVAFVADADNPPARRREANSIVELYQRRTAECAARATLSPPSLRLIGMLMLVPPPRCSI